MTSYDLYSHSPRVPDAASPEYRVPAPVTPIHSPHHSVHSSTSLRTPLHTLSIHEYRKQQSTPLSRIATPSGKTLRRKPSAFALNAIERVPSTKSVLPREPNAAPRSLHSSYSAHQLATQNPSFGDQTGSDHLHRSRSAEPRALGDSISSVASFDSQGKVRHFSTRKRLPRPPVATGPGHHVSYAPVRPTRQIRATLPAPLGFLTEESNLNDTVSTPTPSLSRFPQPPRFESLRESEREKAISFPTTAPTTPPATPATIHYRGASFDLVNPHASLPYHDIVTPSRDFDSSELLALRSSQESQSSVFEMAPKRPLYGDLNAAHAGIVRRTEDAYLSSMLDLPLPPTPAAVTPGSSAYTSPIYSPESCFAPSPLAVRKAPDDSRFSIKQLARTLTKRLTKPLEYSEEEEMQQFRDSDANEPSIRMDTQPLRRLEQTYVPMGGTSYFPISPVSPISPTSSASFHDLGSISGGEEDETEFARRGSARTRDSKGLTSMVPDDLSTQIGRVDNVRRSVPATESEGGPDYDDLASIYASSSIYTGDDRRRSAYQQSLAENRQSTAFLRYSSMGAAGMVNEYSYSDLRKTSRSFSRPVTQEVYRRSATHDDGKTDTISKFIDQYNLDDRTTSLASRQIKSDSNISLIEPYTNHHGKEANTAASQLATTLPGLSQFQFDLESNNQLDGALGMGKQIPPTNPKPRMLKYQPGVPPSAHPPLAPAFQYDQGRQPLSRSEISDIFSNASHVSYGDTRNLLQIPQSDADGSKLLAYGVQPSSSYSQSDGKTFEILSSYSQSGERASPHTPQEALDQAELIFDKAGAKSEPSYNDIPAMWGRQSPVNLARNKRLTGDSARSMDDEKAEWETVAGDSQLGRLSLDSIANYSSSEGSRDNLALTAASLPSWTEQDHARSPSFYGHPSPIRAHNHPFGSSPPRLSARLDSQTAPDVSASGTSSSPPTSSIMAGFRFSNQPTRAVDEPYAFAPWAGPYALSDKETQELLASGPNDDILFEGEFDTQPRRRSYKPKAYVKLLDSSSPCGIGNEAALERENTFDKLTLVGPKGNLTGTPQGTGMHDAGSSVADTSSPGAKLSSSVGACSPRSDYDGFYASPFPATGSVTRIRHSSSATEHHHERTPSQMTLFPSSYNVEPVQASSPLAGSDGRRSLRCSTTFKPARSASRAAVPGQTKLRQMVLAPDARSTVSSKDTRFSRFLIAGGSGRPSTSDTVTPLHPTHLSLDTNPTIRSGNTVSVHQHSPHLLCPEREVEEKDEVRRQKLSWLIFACFCILPPCMFLYRMWGDSIIVSVTQGDLGHCTAKSKRAALIAGIVVNIGLVTAILVPIMVAQALKAI